MVRKLFLVRHATAGDADKDHERTLTPSGERDARHLGRWLLDKYSEIDLILFSSAVRAKTTAEIISEELKILSLSENEEIYESSVRTMLKIVNELPEENENVVIVGHNPTISYFADFLTTSWLQTMHPGSAAILSFENMEWSEVSQNSGSIIEFYSPEDH